MIRVFLFQSVKEKVNGIFERLIILTDFHCVQHFYQCGKILFVLRCFIIDVPNQGTIQKPFGFTQKSSEDFSPSPLVLAISVVTSFKMSFSLWI